MHVGEYNHAVQMYRKCLMVGLLILISGNVINLTFQFYDSHFIFAQTNQAPKAEDQKVSVDADDKVKITLEGKDDDKDDKIQFDIVSDPSHGKLDNFDKSDGTVTYIPEQDYSGDDGFKFKVIDDKGEQSDKASVEIEVKSTNQAPKAEDQKVSVDADDKVKITLEGKDDDKDDKIQFDIVSDPSHGKLDNFDKSDGTVTYIPEQDYSGDDGFKFKVIDDKGEQSDSADVEIQVKAVTQTVRPTNRRRQQQEMRPTNRRRQQTGDETNTEAENQTTKQLLKNNELSANNQSPFAYGQDLSIHMNEKADITLNGKDDDNDPIQFAIVSNPTDASLDNFDTTKGTLTFVPETDYIGNESFAFKVIDDKEVESNVATVSVEVSPLTNDVNMNNLTNQAPKALDQNEATDKNNQLNITLNGKDDDNDPIQFAIVSNPTDASLDNFDTTKGTLTFVPETDYIGNESFAFKVIDDKEVESNVATVSVEVKENNQTNQAPLAFDQSTNESDSDIHKYVVWSGGEEEDRYILFARSTDGGKSFSSPLSLSGSSRSNVFNPEVSSSGNNVYVVWQGQSATGNQDIFLRKSSDYGASFSAAENISNDPGGSGNPDIVAVGNDTHVTWEGTTPGNNFVFYTKSDNGSDFATPQKLSGNQGISYRPEISVKENTITSTDSFTYKAVDDMGAESNVATVDVNLDTNTNEESNLKDNGKSVSIDSAHEVEITLKAEDQNKDPLQFEIITPPSEGRLFNFDHNSGTVKYIPNEKNEIDINWHNYVSGHDRVLTKNIESSDTPMGKDNSDPFKSR
jgi:hypothetical protein